MIIGLLVNPIAGMGGRVGLKGTDGVVEEALERGAEPVSPGRALDFLEAFREDLLSNSAYDLEVWTCPGKMGGNMMSEAGIDHSTIDIDIPDDTSAKDTKRCVPKLYETGVRLLVFVGGDGTARDILDAVKKHDLDDIQVLGIPSGVKMYSGVFVVNPREAVEVIRLVVEGTAGTTDFEIMDADESAFREDEFNLNLYGYLMGPSVPAKFQGSKQASPETVDEQEAKEAIARHVVENMKEDATYILGPGTTVKTVADLLDIKKTVLGVDIYKDGKVYNDVNESKILDIVDDFDKTWIVVSPIGNQGILFGRGNQQISPKIIERVGKDHIIAISTASKLKGIEGEILRVDTGDREVDEMLKGYIRVISDYREIRLVKVE